MENYLIVIGTNRQDSNSARVAGIYKELLKSREVESEIINLIDLPSDFAFSALYDKSGKNQDFNPYREKMHRAHKFIFIVPEYNGSFPGVLKTFIDGLKFPQTFTDKKCALVGVSSGVQGAGLALSHLTDIMNYCGTNVLAMKPKLARIDNALKDGDIVNPLYRSLLEQQVEKLVSF